MATQAEVFKIITGIAAAYPNFTVPKATYQVYARLLADVQPDVLTAAAAKAAATCKFFPTVAEIREAATSLMPAVAGLPTAYEAWGEVKRNVYHSHRPVWSHPLIEKTINCLGGLDAFGQSNIEDEMSWRAQFLRAYQALAKFEHDDAMMLPEVRELRAKLLQERIVGPLSKQLAGGNGHGTA